MTTYDEFLSRPVKARNDLLLDQIVIPYSAIPIPPSHQFLFVEHVYALSLRSVSMLRKVQLVRQGLRRRFDVPRGDEDRRVMMMMMMFGQYACKDDLVVEEIRDSLRIRSDMRGADVIHVELRTRFRRPHERQSRVVPIYNACCFLCRFLSLPRIFSVERRRLRMVHSHLLLHESMILD